MSQLPGAATAKRCAPPRTPATARSLGQVPGLECASVGPGTLHTADDLGTSADGCHGGRRKFTFIAGAAQNLVILGLDRILG